MSERKYSLVVPVILTLFFLASLGGIIGNAITLESNNSFSSFDLDSLSEEELEVTKLLLPSNFESYELDLSYNIKNFNFTDFNILSVGLNFYIATSDLPNEITNITLLESSTYFTSFVNFSREGVQQDSNVVHFYNGQLDSLYLIIGNPDSNTISVDISVNIKNAGTKSSMNAIKVLAIVFSSIFTGIFLIASFYSWFEVFAINWYKPRLMTDKLEKNLERINNKAESWEIILSIISVFLIIYGYSGLLIVTSSSNTFVLGLVGSIVIYYSYSSRQKLQKTIQNVLSQHPNLTLQELSKISGESKDSLKKALLDMIIDNNFPASFDFVTEEIVYDTSKQPIVSQHVEETQGQAQFSVPTHEVVANEIKQEENLRRRPLPKCEYCGVEALSHLAKFCHSCGASMSSAK